MLFTGDMRGPLLALRVAEVLMLRAYQCAPPPSLHGACVHVEHGRARVRGVPEPMRTKTFSRPSYNPGASKFQVSEETP